MKTKNPFRLKVLNPPCFIESLIHSYLITLKNNFSSWIYDEKFEPIFKRNGFYTANDIGTWVEFFHNEKWYVIKTTHDQFVSEIKYIERQIRSIPIADIEHLRRIAAKHNIIEKLLKSLLDQEKEYDLFKQIDFNFRRIQLNYNKEMKQNGK